MKIECPVPTQPTLTVVHLFCGSRMNPDRPHNWHSSTKTLPAYSSAYHQWQSQGNGNGLVLGMEHQENSSLKNMSFLF